MKLSLPFSFLLLSTTANAFVPPTSSIDRTSPFACLNSASALRVSSAQDDYEQPPKEISWKRRALSKFQEFLWPGAQPDPNFSEPLPPGGLGCPFFGSDGFLSGNKVDGPGCFFPQQSAREGHPSIVKFYFFGTPVASVSGQEWVQQLAGMEFSHTEATSPTYNDGLGEQDVPNVFGNDNMNFERDRDQHAFLRRLIGRGTSASAVRGYTGRLTELVTHRIHSGMTSSSADPVSMENLCTEYTLDVAQTLILGLDLTPEEVIEFRRSMNTWLGAMYSPLANLNIPWITKHLPEYHARNYIQAKVEAKIDYLLENGPEDSVLSHMVFAVDDEDENGTKQKLTRKQIIENSLFIIVAAAESTAGSLTLMMFLLGLHPDKFQKLIDEQQEIIQKFGPELTQDILENHSPYLNGVRKEALRMGAMTGGFPKQAKETLVVDGVQIPKGWNIFCNIRLTHMLDPVTRLPDNSHMCVFRGFQPERWFQEETTPSDYLPFGSGPHFCVGIALAKMEMQLFLATLARHVKSFELVKDYQGGQVPVEWNPASLTPRPSDRTMVHKIVTN